MNPDTPADNPVDEPILVHTTCRDKAEAERLARELVEARVAACASVGAEVRSVYPWQGRIESDSEVPLTLKTTAGAFPALEKRLLASHSYDVPELLATPVVEGNSEYIDWLRGWVSAGERNE